MDNVVLCLPGDPTGGTPAQSGSPTSPTVPIPGIMPQGSRPRPFPKAPFANQPPGTNPHGVQWATAQLTQHLPVGAAIASATAAAARTSFPAASSAMVTVGNGRFRLGGKLGAGSFGEVFKALDLELRDTVAVKMERISPTALLEYESRVLMHVTKYGQPTIVGFPQVRFAGREGEYNVLVMELLGPSLERLYQHCGQRLSPRCVCFFAIQAVCRLQYLHARGFLHRDMKPDNFVLGTGKRAHHVYMIDFGLAKRYRDLRTQDHVPVREGRKMTGTVRYVSLNTHLGLEQSRRDDLESLGHVLVYLGRGNVPWQHVAEKTKQLRNERIAAIKMAVPPESLCEGAPLPVLQLLTYARGLEYADEPDYDAVQQYFIAYLQGRGWWPIDYTKLDWRQDPKHREW